MIQMTSAPVSWFECLADIVVRVCFYGYLIHGGPRAVEVAILLSGWMISWEINMARRLDNRRTAR